MPLCSGNSDDHCCYLNGSVCKHLEENTVPGRHWVCGLRRKLGGWDLVHSSQEYQRDVQPFWDKFGGSCGTYPQPGRRCGVCGLNG